MPLAVQFLVVAVLSLTVSAEEPSSEDLVRLLKALRNHVYFDHILILTATRSTNCSISRWKIPRWSGRGDWGGRIDWNRDLPPPLHEGWYTVRTQLLQKELSLAQIASTSLAIKAPCNEMGNQFAETNEFIASKETWVGGLRTYLMKKYSGGNTPLILMPFASEYLMRFLEQWWLDSALSQANMNWLMVGDNSSVFLPDFISIRWNSRFMLASWSDHSAKISEVIPSTTISHNNYYYLGDLQSSGLTWTKSNFYSRRSDLTGYTISTTTVHDPPFSYARKDKQGVGGIAGRIWTVLSEQLNLRSVYSEIVDQTATHSIIVAFDSFWQVQDDTHFTYTTTLFKSTFRLFMKHLEVTDMVWGRILAPFSFNLWIVIGATIILAATCILVLLQYEFCPKPALHTISGAILTSIGVFCQQHPEMQTVTTRSRLVFLAIHLATLVLLATYSGSVISVIIRMPTPVSRNIQLISESDSFPVLTTKDGAGMYVSKTSNDTILRKLFRRRDRRPHHVPKTVTEGFVRVCENQCALFATLETVEHLQNRIKCKIVSSPDFSLHFPVSFPVSKDITVVRMLNHKITLLRSSGLLKKLLKPKYQNYRPPECEDFCSITFTNVLPHFCLLGAGMLLSLLLLFAEKFIASRKVTYKTFLH